MFKARVCFPRGTFQTNLWPDSFGKNRFESRVFDYNRDFDWSSRQISPKNQDLMVQSTSKPTFFEIHSFSFKKTRAVYYLPWDHLVRSVLYVDIRFILLFSPSFSYGNVQKWYQVSFWGDNDRNTHFPVYECFFRNFYFIRNDILPESSSVPLSIFQIAFMNDPQGSYWVRKNWPCSTTQVC